MIIEINLRKLDRGTKTEWRTVTRGGKTFKQRFRVGEKVEPKEIDKDLKDIIDQLSKYSKEYGQEGNIEMQNDCESILELLNINDIDGAQKVFESSELRYEIGNTASALDNYKTKKYIEKEFGLDWGTKPGKYTVYRAGSISDPKRGIFFSMDKKGAEAYATSEIPTNKYTIDIKNPFVVTEVKEAYSILANKTMQQILKQRDSAKNVNEWWRKIDAKVAALAKKKGYDAITYTDPAPPAVRELILLDDKNIIGVIND